MSIPSKLIQHSFLLLALVFPWLYPFAGGPSPAVTPWLVSLGCLACVLIWVQRNGRLQSADIARGWLAAAAISSLIGLLQYLGLGDGGSPWLNVTDPGEAFANLRQRNQFATLTSIGLATLLWSATQPADGDKRRVLGETGRLAVAVLLAMGNAASSSRTGLLELLLLGGLVWLWGGLRQSPTRRLLLVALVAYALALVVLPALAGWNPFGHGMLERLHSGDAMCSSRLTLWRNVLHLIAQRPWLGWGWGELDYAHFMAEYDGARFCDILGNAHNLPLHLAVEMGLPVAGLVCGAIVWLVGRVKPWLETDPARQLAWCVLALIAVHSMLEYPLWYGPFQMAAGLSIGLLWRRSPGASVRMFAVSVHGVRIVAVVLLGVSYAAWDYHRVSQIYLVPEQRMAAYRTDTLEKIRDSWLFREQVRFAELTLTPLTPQNARQLNAMAHELLHFSPETRVVEKLIESAFLLRRDDEARAFMQRYQAAYPQAYAQWVKAR